MSAALRKTRWDPVVQWRGDNLQEVKEFVIEYLPDGTQVTDMGGLLILDSFNLDGTCEYKLQPTDWLTPFITWFYGYMHKCHICGTVWKDNG